MRYLLKWGVSAELSYLYIRFLSLIKYIKSNKVTITSFRCDKSRTASTKWVENSLFFERCQFNQCAKQLCWFLCNVKAAFSTTEPRPDDIVWY